MTSEPPSHFFFKTLKYGPVFCSCENRNRVLSLGLSYVPLLKFQLKRDQALSNRRSGLRE